MGVLLYYTWIRNRRLMFFFSVWLGLISRGACLSQIAQPMALPEEPLKAAVLSDRKVPLLSKKLTLADFDAMAPKPEIAAQLTHVDAFIQQYPLDGHAATQRTEVWFGRTSTAFYVAFACFDDHVKLLRNHMARRENILNDDTVSLLVDPFQDRRLGVLFTVNPAGVQADASWTENSQPDYSYDSEGRHRKGS